MSARRTRQRVKLADAASQGSIDPALNVVIIRAGVANKLLFSANLLRGSAERFAGAPVFVDHASFADLLTSGGRSVRDLVGIIQEPRWHPGREQVEARLALASSAAWLADVIRYFAPHQRIFGLSADLWITREGDKVISIEEVNSVDVVCRPAAGGRFLPEDEHPAGPAPNQGDDHDHSVVASPAQLRKEPEMPPEPTDIVTDRAAASPTPSAVPSARVQTGRQSLPPDPDDPTAAVAQQLPSAVPSAITADLIELHLAQSRLPDPLKDTVRALAAVDPNPLAAARERIAQLERAWAQATAQASIRGLGQVSQMQDGLDRITLAFEKLMGVGDTAAHGNAARLSGIREFYDLMTGDWERYGVYRPDRVSLANATTSTMAQVVANVLNKVLLRAFELRPQWWKPIAYEEDFASMQEVKWITLGGFSDLDTVTEGNPYTEKTWDDYAESSAFVKKGNYIGLTLEMIDRDDVAAVRAIPRKLGLAANRTLGAAVSALFTANAGVGPTLADTVALFHTDHGNLGTSALDAAAWQAAVKAMFEQAEYHSSKALGVRPAFLLAPIELESTAITLFTTTLEPGLAGNTRAIEAVNHSVITVPDWTDPTDWAAVADPRDLPGVCIGYRFGRAPELFVADSPVMGSMFTNDEMRIKVRFVYAVGVGDYRALYKSNVSDA